MCGPKFCSMRISHEIRDQVEAGMAGKAAEFAAGGNRVYLPVAGS
jgi:phosphomethylpyrimidine synthase